MIPLMDDYLREFLAEKIKFLKKYPSLIDVIFNGATRETITKLREFITQKRIRVTIGYPREQSQMPCYVIVLAPENEQPLGLGDGEDEFDEAMLGLGDDWTEEDNMAEIKALPYMGANINGTYMNSNYRIECWSDNGDLTSYMYAILKWAMWTSRLNMYKLGWLNITISGTDLEPVPDYMPVFIYRRSLMITATVEHTYFKGTDEIAVFIDIIEHPENYYLDEDNSVIRKSDDELIIPGVMYYKFNMHTFTQLEKVGQ